MHQEYPTACYSSRPTTRFGCSSHEIYWHAKWSDLGVPIKRDGCEHNFSAVRTLAQRYVRIQLLRIHVPCTFTSHRRPPNWLDINFSMTNKNEKEQGQNSFNSINLAFLNSIMSFLNIQSTTLQLLKYTLKLQTIHDFVVRHNPLLILLRPYQLRLAETTLLETRARFFATVSLRLRAKQISSFALIFEVATEQLSY